MSEFLIKKTDEEQRIVMGAVYVPNVIDSHGDYATADTIRKACHDFMRKSDMMAVDIMHDNVRYNLPIVECFITRKGDPDFPVEGTWVAAVHIPDENVWEMVKTQKINGFSMEAMAVRAKKEIDSEVPAIWVGKTMTAEDGHEHELEIMFDEDGKFLGGRTSVAKDAQGREHFHIVSKTVISEETLSHAHKFAHEGKVVKAC